MAHPAKYDWLIYIFCLFLALFYFWGMPQVPFHPDESTQIYMSADFDQYVENPLALAMSPGTELSREMVYRSLDAPLNRYLIGFARMITHTAGLAADWDWSLNWQQNQYEGAYPSVSLLSIARLIPTLLIPLSICLFYFSVRKILPVAPALFAACFLGLNPLVLLHARRAMSESVLLFGVIFFLWAISRAKINPILVGFSLAVAYNSKQTAILLIPVGIIAVCMTVDEEQRLKNMLAQSGILLAVFSTLTLILNPYYWKAPLVAFSTGYQARFLLTQLQLNDHLSGIKPGIFISFLSLVNNLFISPPAFSEIANFPASIEKNIQDYQSILPHIWGRGFFAGTLHLSIAFGGLYVMYKRFNNYFQSQKRVLVLIIVITITLSGGILYLLPIPWQRYIIPLLPLSAFWFTCGLLPIFDFLKSLIDVIKQRFINLDPSL